jgi:hypothetical protein
MLINIVYTDVDNVELIGALSWVIPENLRKKSEVLCGGSRNLAIP